MLHYIVFFSSCAVILTEKQTKQHCIHQADDLHQEGLLGMGVDVLLVVDERNGNEGGVVQNDLGCFHRWSDGEVVNSQHDRK